MRLYLFAFILLSLLLPSHAQAAASAWQREPEAAVRLVSGVDGTDGENEIPLGVDIHLEPGWHTYWRTPGETGLPPQLNWTDSLSESGNLESATLWYPAPVRMEEQGLSTIGYHDDFLLPVTARLRVPGKPLQLKAGLDLLLCKDICLPRHFDLALNIPAGKALPSPEAPLLDQWRARVPGSNLASAIAIIDVQRRDTGILLTFARKQGAATPDIFVENERNITFAKPEPQEIGPTRASYVLKPAGTLPEGVSLKSLPVTVTIIDGDRSTEQKLDNAFVPEKAVTQTSASQPFPLPKTPPLWVIVLLAILGGFILNLTPCVLPVLSLKILSVISHGGGEHRAVRRSFLTTAAGILFSFLILAGATIVLKITGHAVGWGVQFQQPLFLVFLITLLTLFAANLWGLFEIALPRLLADRFDPIYHPKLAGDFVTGAFATLMATPCSVPFLGTAIGFALAAGSLEILVVFAGLGVGMVMPYLAVALWPQLATLLPKPGHWMITLRRILGSVMGLTILWLLYVLRAEIAPEGVTAVTVCMLATVVTLHRQQNRPWNAFNRLAILFLVAGAFGTAFFAKTHVADTAANSRWQAFDETAIERYVGEGKRVFVDVTADWCVNCKANKKFTLGRDDITRCLFDTPGIVAMRADWTNPDPKIGAFLRHHHRYGIPFNIIYGPDAPQGIVLPELLTPGIVLDGLTRADNKSPQCNTAGG